MPFGKLINENLTILKQPIHTENGDIFTNDEIVFLKYGYKKIVYTEPPKVPEGFYHESKWTETETEIVQEWGLVPLPPKEATSEDYEEALAKMGVDVND